MYHPKAQYAMGGLSLQEQDGDLPLHETNVSRFEKGCTGSRESTTSEGKWRLCKVFIHQVMARPISGPW